MIQEEERLSPGRCKYHKARPLQTDSGWPGAMRRLGGTREGASCRYSFSFVQELSLLYCQWGQGIPCCWYRELIWAEGTNTKWTLSTLWSKQLSRWLQNPDSMLQGKIFFACDGQIKRLQCFILWYFLVICWICLNLINDNRVKQNACFVTWNSLLSYFLFLCFHLTGASSWEGAPATNFAISLFPHKAFTGGLQSAGHNCTSTQLFSQTGHRKSKALKPGVK